VVRVGQKDALCGADGVGKVSDGVVLGVSDRDSEILPASAVSCFLGDASDTARWLCSVQGYDIEEIVEVAWVSYVIACLFLLLFEMPLGKGLSRHLVNKICLGGILRSDGGEL
jgi:hypothetical protein